MFITIVFKVQNFSALHFNESRHVLMTVKSCLRVMWTRNTTCKTYQSVNSRESKLFYIESAGVRLTGYMDNNSYRCPRLIGIFDRKRREEQEQYHVLVVISAVSSSRVGLGW